MRVAAVVLNYRTPDDTLLAVRSLLASRHPLQRIVIVDNDPSRTARAIAQNTEGETVVYVPAGRNLGFSGGVNLGVRTARDAHSAHIDAFLLVNSDAIVPPDCVARMLRALAESPAAGIVGPVIASRSKPGTIVSLGLSYDARTGRMHELGVGWELKSLDRQTSSSRTAVSGCVMLVKSAVFDAIGLFDENYFFSFEDLDFCLRARRAGFDTMLAADATAYHEGGRSIGYASAQRLYFAARNHLLLASRTSAHDPARVRVVRGSAIVAMNVAHAVTAKGGSVLGRLMAVFRGVRDHLAGQYGGTEPRVL